jgi:hypothetical protein
MRRRLLLSCLIDEAEVVGSGDALNPSSNLPCLRSRVLAMNSTMIASGRPKTIKATKAPTTKSSTGPPDFAYLSRALQSAACRGKSLESRPGDMQGSGRRYRPSRRCGKVRMALLANRFWPIWWILGFLGWWSTSRTVTAVWARM